LKIFTQIFRGEESVPFLNGQKIVAVKHLGQKIGFRAGLPDGLFSNQKSKFGYILEGHGMDNVFAFYYHLKYFMAIWYNLLQFGIVCGIFSQFWYVWTKKNLATLFQSC
jgi:hypothetical protein